MTAPTIRSSIVLLLGLAASSALTGDGRIDGADLLELLSAWGPCA